MKTSLSRLSAFVVLVLVLAVVLPASGQTTFFTRANSGLVDDFVTKGTLYRGLPVFGTESGVSILQGDRFENWRRGDMGFPEAPVRGIAVLADRLWVGTYGKGLARLEEGRWRSFTMADSGLNDDFVTAMLAHGNRLFVGTRAGLVVYDGLLWRPVRLDADRPVTVTALAADRTGVLVGTNLGVFRLDEGLQPIVIDLGLEFLPWIQALDVAGGIAYIGFDGGVLALATDGRRRFWSGTQLPSPRMFDLVALDDGALLATGRGLVRVYLNGTVTLLDVSQIRSLSGVSTSALLRGSGVWWVGFAGAGLLRLADLTGFSPYQSPGGGQMIFGAPSAAVTQGGLGLPAIQGLPGGVTQGLSQGGAQVVGLDRAQQGGFGVLSAVPGPGAQTPFVPAAPVVQGPVAPVAPVTVPPVPVQSVSPGGFVGGQAATPLPAPFGGSIGASQGTFAGEAGSQSPSPVQIEQTPPRVSPAPTAVSGGSGERFELPGNIRSAIEEGEYVWAASLDGLYRWKAGETARRIGPAMPCQAIALVKGRVLAIFENGEVFAVTGDQAQPLALKGLPPAPLSLTVIGETLAIGTDMGLFFGALPGGGEIKSIGSLKGKRVGMMQGVETLLWMATDDGLYKFDLERSFSERISETTAALTAVRINEAGVLAADRHGIVTRYNSLRMIESWNLKGGGRINGFGSTEAGEVLIAAENGIFAVKPGRPEIVRYDARGAQGFFRRAGKTWVIRRNVAELFRPGLSEPFGQEIAKPGQSSGATPVSSAGVQGPSGPSASGGAFKIGAVQVFAPPADDVGGTPRMGDAGAPLLVPPGDGRPSSPGSGNALQPLPALPAGGDPAPAWANYRRPPKPKNLGYFKDVLPMMGRACISCHTSGAGRYFPLNDPKTVISYFKQGGLDRYLQFVEPGNGMYGVVSPTDTELLQIWVKEGCKE